MIHLLDVTKKYTSGRVTVKAIDSVSLDIKKGDMVEINGASASGKTTLLNIIGCITRISSGSYVLDDIEISHLPDHFLSDIRKLKTGFVFQHFNLIPGIPTWENVSIPLIPSGMPLNDRKEKAMDLLKWLKLETRKDFTVNELSGGEQQRAALARALINDPDIIIMDEPFSSMDERHVSNLIDIMGDLKNRGRTIIISSHGTRTGMSGLVDRTVTCREGKIY